MWQFRMITVNAMYKVNWTSLNFKIATANIHDIIDKTTLEFY
jgi:hypothetical protein